MVSVSPAGAELVSLVVESVDLRAVGVPSEPIAAGTGEPVAVSAVPVLLELSEADDESDEGEGVGLGHKFSYTNCSGAPLQVVVAPASNVLFGYIQQLPEAYGELFPLCGLKTT